MTPALVARLDPYSLGGMDYIRVQSAGSLFYHWSVGSPEPRMQ